MDKLILTISFLFFISSILQAQIIPTEIQYNPPEFGQDSLEYLELYNNSGQSINLEGYTFTQGVSYTFPDVDFPPESYIVLAVNDTAFLNTFGFSPLSQWESGALNNSGEPIELQDALGNTVFITEYADNDPWPAGADGDGFSLELCDLDEDVSMASSWGLSDAATGIMIDGVEIYGTPGQANNPDCSERFDHRIEVSSNVFTPADITITEGETILWENINGFHNVDGRQTTYPNNPESFYSGSTAPAPWTFTHTFSEVGQYTYECTPHAALGMIGTITVEPEQVDPDEFPNYDIGVVTTNNVEGVPDSLGVQCSLQGLIHGANLRESGYIFTIIDSLGDGIGVFRSSDIGNYQPKPGDEVLIEGSISQFNGLTQIEAGNIILLSENNDLVSPMVISGNVLSEITESQYVLTGPVTFVDPDQWDGTGNSFNFDVEDVNGIRYDIRIDRNTDLAGLDVPPLPNGFDDTFILYGVGGQFDSSLPFDDGYQLRPSFTSDFEVVTSLPQVQEASFLLYPNPAKDWIQIQNLPKNAYRLVIYDTSGKVLQEVINPSSHHRLNVSRAIPGTYIIQLIGDNLNESKLFSIE
ncbi:MAG TPA: plastocyanin/azurin family copper-binding protein [Bacteroidales bacterium]|nr:plastocyanin/azurin family copper-binding protein [Bacteroidales bacterium]